jgi:hypothetical protein
MKLEFSKITRISNFIEIPPVGVECLHAVRQTGRLDVTKLIVGIHSVVKAPKKFCFTNTHSYITRPTPTC